jgi:chromosome partitioning protein
MTFYAVAGRKGGVGKTTTAVNFAAILAETYDAALVDADENRGATGWLERSEDVNLTIITENESGKLARLRELQKWDAVVVDTPGLRKTGELEAVAGAVDVMILPTEIGLLDLRALIYTIKSVVIPAGVPYRVLLTLVSPHPQAKPEIDDARGALEKEGIPVFTTAIRDYTAHRRAVETSTPISRYRGLNARAAEQDYRKFTAEVTREWAPSREGR